MSEQIIGIMGALPEEIAGIEQLLHHKAIHKLGMRTYYSGTLSGKKVVVVHSRIGKVAAAATVSCLALHFKITDLIFTGVAGGIDSTVKIGDVVVAQALLQHDMDASPLVAQYEIPLLGKTYFNSDESWQSLAFTQIKEMLDSQQLHQLISAENLNRFDIHQPQVHRGTIASGDLFFSTNQQKAALQQALPEVLCAEMEGAAVAQVCYEFQIPFVVIRTISDDADEHSTFDFQAFITRISSLYSIQIIQNLLQ